MLGLSIFLTLQTFRARQNHLFRTKCAPFARRRSQSPAGTTHISPPWQRWENVHQLQEAPESGDTSISRVAAPQSAKCLEFSTYENRACNSRRICTSIFIGLKSVWNQHLQKIFRGAPRHGSKPAIREWITCSSGRAGLHFRPARPEAFVLRTAYFVACASPLECALTQMAPGGPPPRTSWTSGASRRNEVGGGIAANVRRRCRAEARRYINTAVWYNGGTISTG